jgi:hypothetical protein
MPSVSKEAASEQIAFEGIDIRAENFEGGYPSASRELSAR